MRCRSRREENTGAPDTPRVFLLHEGNEPNWDELPAQPSSHFPGPVTVLGQWVLESGPQKLVIASAERHGDKLLNCTTIVGRASDAAGCWPTTKPHIPAGEEWVAVILEEPAEES